jgi:tripartite ATP-independent transporter DctP family solute receptor
MKLYVRSVVLVGIFMIATACYTSFAAAAEEPAFNLTFATSAPEGAILDISMKYAASLITERSGGKITVDCFPASQLGSDRELIEGCQMGTISMVIGATAPQVSFVPALALFDLPNAFKDIEVAKMVLQNFQKIIEPKYAGASLTLLALYPTVFRYMSSNIAVRKVEDFSGIKIRTMENPYHMTYWSALGANPTPLAFSELYVALQQGLVDAQENPLDVFQNARFYEQQKYVINTKHNVFVATVVMNADLWARMPAEYQSIISKALSDAADYTISIAQEKTAEIIKDVEAKGVEVINLDDDLLAQMLKKSQPVYDLIHKDLGDESVKQYLDAIKAVQR